MRSTRSALPTILIDEAKLAIREADLHRRTGRVVDLIGLITEATGLEAEVGEVCMIETGRGRATVPAEVVGFRQGRTLLMPLGEPKGIGPGSKVVATGQPLKVDVSDALLGRALDGLGNPIDGKGPIDHTHWYPAEQAPPDPLSRPRINERVSLGRAVPGCVRALRARPAHRHLRRLRRR